ncbi:restriction endonuclease [Bacteroides sp. OttesenSCG-928-E20]|nr:restriction endonuclease [Bacteroides sp. OttesenSCG-928-N06]MDL2299746.1 restriction endonuclease [Bacteroides sp. OttesenSCG-928-E20]MDL2304086.1 restriction endonuclease [Bacteroides sp. OttesenSCG-928-D19]
MNTKDKLNTKILIAEALVFCNEQSKIEHKELYGVTDGKAVGTFIEHKFQMHLQEKYEVTIGSSAKGIDLPEEDILTDIKVTSIKQPQSSSPFKDAKQKIFGLGYNLLVFVYEKADNPVTQTAILNFVSCSFIHKERTADYTTTFRLREMIEDQANEADIIGYLQDKNIPADEITLQNIAKEILKNPPMQGYLTISNALQWRLQYQRIVSLTEDISGIDKIVTYNRPL